MWEWILTTLNKIGSRIKNSEKIDDAIQETCMLLLQDDKLAENIYSKKNIALLTKLLHVQLYEQTSKLYFENKVEFVRYQKIYSVCEKYNIQPIPENAYKIAGIIDESPYSIALVENILKDKKEKVYNCNIDFFGKGESDDE